MSSCFTCATLYLRRINYGPVCLSVCVCVCLSVTRRYHIESAERIVVVFDTEAIIFGRRHILHCVEGEMWYLQRYR